MIFILGDTIKEKITGGGNHDCPVCKLTKPYNDVVQKCWATILFIPLVPYDTLAQYRQCTGCGHTFIGDESIDAQYSQLQLCVCYSLAYIVKAEIGSECGEALYQKIYQKLMGDDCPFTFDEAARLTHSDQGSIFERLKSRKQLLDWSGKLMVIEACYLVVASLRELNRDDTIGLNMIGSALDVDMSAVKQVIQHSNMADKL